MLPAVRALVLLSLVAAPSTSKPQCPPPPPPPLNISGGFPHCTNQSQTLRLGNSYDCHRGCSNASLVYILLFGLMGIMGVAALAALGLTVSTGTFNAVLLYVNIVQANYHVFFRQEDEDGWRHLRRFLTVFLSWLNLEWGFETCFGRKLDATSKTNLRYVFPIYMCLLAGIFVRISNWGIRTRQHCRKLAHSVLATTLLMAFSPMLRTFIDTLLVEKGVQGCWLFDTSERFIYKKHRTVFGVGVFMLLCLFLFALLITLAPLLESIAHYKPFSWLQKPFISAIVSKFQLPLTRSNPPWPGICLAVRVLLFATAAVVRSNHVSADTNLGVVAVTLLCLALLVWFLGVPYRRTLANATLAAFLVNLGVLAVLSSQDAADWQQHVLAYTMVGVAALKFAALVGYHAVQRTQQLVTCVGDYRQMQDIEDDMGEISGQALEEGILLESVNHHESLEAEYCEVASDVGTGPSSRLEGERDAQDLY